MFKLHLLRLAKVAYEALKGTGFHAGNALRADLLLIRKYADGGFLGLILLKDGGKLRIGAYSVIVTISRNKAAVKANLTNIVSRNRDQLR